MTRVLVPAGALGLGFDPEALARGIALKPDIIAIDGGSTDSGPSYLGRGVSKYSRASTKAEWKKLIEAREAAGCPLVIGTAGTCGADSTVDWLYDITLEICAELDLHPKIARLYSNQPASRVTSALAASQIRPLHPAPEIDDSLVESCTNIVALAGAEQIGTALQTGAEIVIAGRTTDTATIAALPLMNGDHAGAAWHGAKIAECGAICSTNPMSGVVVVDFDATGFTIRPLAEDARCTPRTVSAHMLYENSNPFLLYEPGGYLDVTAATYTQATADAVRVEGSTWVVEKDYTVKLEGARRTGFQTILIATVRDRHYVENIDVWCADILKKHHARVIERTGYSADSFTVELRKMGLDSTLGQMEKARVTPSEVGVLGIVTAETQAQANEIGKMLNPFLLHHPLTQNEEMPTFAFPFSPAEIDRGAIYEFCLNHVMILQDPMEAFRLEITHA